MEGFYAVTPPVTILTRAMKPRCITVALRQIRMSGFYRVAAPVLVMTRALQPRLITLRSLTGRKFLFVARFHHSVPPSCFDTELAGMMTAMFLAMLSSVLVTRIAKVTQGLRDAMLHAEEMLHIALRIRNTIRRELSASKRRQRRSMR